MTRCLIKCCCCCCCRESPRGGKTAATTINLLLWGQFAAVVTDLCPSYMFNSRQFMPVFVTVFYLLPPSGRSRTFSARNKAFIYLRGTLITLFMMQLFKNQSWVLLLQRSVVSIAPNTPLDVWRGVWTLAGAPYLRHRTPAPV